MIASILVDVASMTLREGVFGQHRGLKKHASQSRLKRKIAQLVVSADVASGLEQLVRGTHVNVTLTIEREVAAREGTIFSIALVPHTGMRGVMPVPTSQPGNLPVPYAVSATRLSGFKPKVSSVRTIMVLIRGHLVVGAGLSGFHVHDDRVFDVDQVIEPVTKLDAFIGFRGPEPNTGPLEKSPSAPCDRRRDLFVI